MGECPDGSAGRTGPAPDHDGLCGPDSGTVPMPFPCPSPFDEPGELTRLRECPGLPMVPTATGDAGWLVTRHSDLLELCGDRRIGRSHPAPESAPRLWDAALFRPQSNFRTELHDHQRWRHVLARRFGARHLAGQRRRARAVFDEVLDTMIVAGPPADLCEFLAEPFAAAMIFDFLGVPRGDRGLVRAWSDGMRDPHDRERATADCTALTLYLRDLLHRKRARPADDALSDLVTVHAPGGPLTEEQQVEAAGHLFFGGYETMVGRVAYGVLYLLAHPDQYAALARDPSLSPGAVEEIVRLAVPGGSWIPRYALADIDRTGGRIRAGDLVVFAVQSANRDPRRFRDAGVFDITRTPNPHVGFGHGKFYCLGAALARLELLTVVENLPRRLPRLRPHTPWTALRADDTKITGGLRALPVSW